MRLKGTLLAAVVSVLMMSGMLVAQATGGITGTVIDPNGNPVTNFNDVAVQLTNTTTSAAFKAPLDEKTATFAFANLPAGTYDLVVPVGGALYQNFTQKGVVVKAGETRCLCPALRLEMNLGSTRD